MCFGHPVQTVLPWNDGWNPFSFFAGDGLIQEKELQHVMRACMDENGMKFDEGEVDELTRALFQVRSNDGDCKFRYCPD